MQAPTQNSSASSANTGTKPSYLVQITEQASGLYVITQLALKDGAYRRTNGMLTVDRNRENPDTRLLAAVKTVLQAELQGTRHL